MGSGPCTGASWARGWGPQKGPYFGPYLGHILTPFWSPPGQKGLKSLYRKVDMGSGALREWLRTPLRMAQKGVQNDLFLGHILTPFWSPPGQYRSKRGSNPFAYSHIGPMYLPIGAQNPSQNGPKRGQKGVHFGPQNDLFLGHILTPFWSPPGQYRSKRGSNPFAYSHIGPMYLPIGAQNPSKKGSKSGQK